MYNTTTTTDSLPPGWGYGVSKDARCSVHLVTMVDRCAQLATVVERCAQLATVQPQFLRTQWMQEEEINNQTLMERDNQGLEENKNVLLRKTHKQAEQKGEELRKRDHVEHGENTLLRRANSLSGLPPHMCGETTDQDSTSEEETQH